MSSTRVLVTGANGFIGSSVKRAFENAGALVTGVDVRSAPGVVDVDLADRSQVQQLFDGGGYDVIAHLAASAVGASGLLASAHSDPIKAVDVNIAATVRLLEFAKETGASRFIYASSTTVYGPAGLYGPTNHRITEDAALLPASVYGATKASAEQLGRCLTEGAETDFVALRLPLVYGPKRWYGGALSPLLEILEAINDRNAVAVSVGTAIGDWLHVDDAASAFVAVAQAVQPASAYHLVGHTGTMVDLARQILELVPGNGVSLHCRYENEEQAPPLINDARAREDLSFDPAYSDIYSAADSLVVPHHK